MFPTFALPPPVTPAPRLHVPVVVVELLLVVVLEGGGLVVVVVEELLQVTVNVTLPVDGVTVTDCGVIWHDSPLSALTMLPVSVADDVPLYVNVFPVLVPQPNRPLIPGTPSIVALGLVLTSHSTLPGALTLTVTLQEEGVVVVPLGGGLLLVLEQSPPSVITVVDPLSTVKDTVDGCPLICVPLIASTQAEPL